MARTGATRSAEAAAKRARVSMVASVGVEAAARAKNCALGVPARAGKPEFGCMSARRWT